MPISKEKDKYFIIGWKPEWDIKILIAATKFMGRYIINWKKAETEGYLKGLPKSLSTLDISKRCTYLKRKDSMLYKKKNKENLRRSKETRKTNILLGKRWEVFKGLSEELKLKHGYKSKEKWNDKQRKLLQKLVDFYRKSKVCIDWKSLFKDKRISKLPEGYTLQSLRKYYWSATVRSTETGKELHRKRAMEYKKKTYKKYIKDQERRRTMIKNAVNEHLINQLKVR